MRVHLVADRRQAKSSIAPSLTDVEMDINGFNKDTEDKAPRQRGL